MQETIFDLKMEFQSTRPMRGATYGEELAFWDEIISIHAPREGRDFELAARVVFARHHFNPRAPRGARRSGKVVYYP